MKYELDDVLAYIVEYKTAHDGISPTLREMMTALDISSTSEANRAVRELVKQGRLKLHPRRGKNRNLMVVGGQWRWVA